MKIQNKRRSEDVKPTGGSSFIDNDFASGFEDSKFEKFKPLFKVLIALIVITGIGYGAYAYLGNQSDETVHTANTSQPNSNEMTQLEQCVDDAWNNHETPEESDPNFYPKLIAGYDAHLACYDTYPDENSATNRLSIESARKSAIDSSDEYKDTYLSNNSYDYTPSSSGSSSQYSSDSSPSGNGSSIPSNPSNHSNPSQGNSSTQPAVDTQWCSAKKAEVDSLYASYQEARNKVNAIDTQLRNISTARPPGFTGTQGQLDAWRSSERQRLTTEKSPLVTQQNNAYASYNASQSEYRSKSCY
ncbi:MAG TPA: hypothetical protein PKD19_02825 [Candidatus Saccharibacteria bacterium]|nr:hypothetical protein [Candidatus Saccharibacteria bacterium]